jgi:hypothetical protein
VGGGLGGGAGAGLGVGGSLERGGPAERLARVGEREPIPAAAETPPGEVAVQLLGDRLCVATVGIPLGVRELQLDRRADLQLTRGVLRKANGGDIATGS